jgi:hypothetical protein
MVFTNITNFKRINDLLVFRKGAKFSSLFCFKAQENQRFSVSDSLIELCKLAVLNFIEDKILAT